MSVSESITVGLEHCLNDPPAVLEIARFGLLANQASVDRDFRYAWDVLAEQFPGQLRTIFSPQHGLWGEQQANMIESPHTRHRRLAVPVYSLYSDTRRPTPEMLDELDVLVVDLQDVGTRIYTYIWTVSHCLEACAAAGIPVVILDRPNPLGGELVEGPLLDPGYRSFVGRASIPMRHALTLAELTRFVNDDLQIGAEVYVVPMQGWSRSMSFAETGRVWIAPSPNLPRLEGVLTYPGQVLLEGTNLSEGRGTTTPFEAVGAPFIEPDELAAELARFDLAGVRFRPVWFLPTFDKWKGERCGGVYLHVTDSAAFRPYRTTIAILAAVARLWPKDFRWLPPPYEYETVHMPIDILSGGPQLREAIDRGSVDLRILDRLSECDQGAWSQRTAPYRLYG